jgi:DNA-binding transcriptional regulator YiaG
MAKEFLSRLIRRATSRRKWKEDRKTAEKVLSKRRERYANDEDYAESIKEAVRRRRQEKGPSKRKRSYNRDKVIVINGVSVTLLSSGKAAGLIGVSSRTLVNWEKKGYIPLNRAKDTLGRRWYPSEFVMFLAQQSAKRPGGRLNEWSERVKEAWQEIQLSDRAVPIVGDHLEEHNG